jgi:hypothetical protein
MGVFEYIPETGKRIFLKCKSIHGLEKQFELPQPSTRTYALAAFSSDHNLLIEVNRSVHAPDIPCFLLAHCRGVILYFSEWNTADESILFDAEEFPAGIIQFILFDQQMNPLSERLVFSRNYDKANLAFQTDKASYTKREKVVVTLREESSLTFSPSERAGVRWENVGASWAHFSVAVTDDKDVTVDSLTTIQSSLLLSSELRGYIENPAWYLQDNPKSIIALDYLMLTHGWRRYAIPDVVKGNPKSPQIPFQMSQEISGKAKTLTLSRPVTNAEISILSRDGDIGLTSTDEKGSFIFQDIEYPDSTSFFIQALGSRGSSRIDLVLDKESYPKLIYALQSPVAEIPAISEETKSGPESDAFITKAEQRARYDEDMWVIHLGELEVTASRINRREEARLRFWANELSDVTIRREEIEKRSPQTVTDMLRNIAGVRVDPLGNIIIRESGNLFSTYKPIVVIDGVSIEWPDSITSIYDSPLEAISVQDVESIDVIKGAGAAAFGIRGAGGAISITTKRGGTDIIRPDEFNYTVFTSLGYQKPVEFYSPDYETLESKFLTIPDFRTTIFWKPDIIISNEEEEAAFEFFTSDFPSTYSVVIEGLTSDGRIVRQVEKIRVE